MNDLFSLQYPQCSLIEVAIGRTPECISVAQLRKESLVWQGLMFAGHSVRKTPMAYFYPIDAKTSRAIAQLASMFGCGQCYVLYLSPVLSSNCCAMNAKNTKRAVPLRPASVTARKLAT